MTAEREGPPDPIEHHGRLLGLIIGGELDAALRLSSHLHAHCCSIPRDVQLEQCCWQDSFYVQGIKHALEFVVTARDAGRINPDARPDSSLVSREQGVA